MNHKAPIILLLATALLLSATHQDDKKAIAKVHTILGKEVYVLSEPVREYEVVEKLSTALTTALVGRQTIQKQMHEVINRASKRVESGKLKDFDAAMTTDGEAVVLIKFK